MKPMFLSTFTPSMMPHEVLEAVFVQRQELAARLVDLIAESATTGSKQQTLLIGPRGIGKTHLVSLVYHRVRAREDLKDKLLIAWLREEEWGVSAMRDVLMRILSTLAAEYNDATLKEKTEHLYELAADSAEREAGDLLKQYVAGRTLLVLAENLDDIFAGLGEQGQQRLRAYMQENPFITTLATSQSLFGGVSADTSPFYGFFRIQHLEALTFEEVVELLAKIAEWGQDQELVSFIRTPAGRARIRAIHHLAGGNHRVYVIFSQFLTRESLDELVQAVMQTLEKLTPYYQSRMAWLSPQQRKLVDYLCDCRGAAPVKQLAQRCFITEQVASRQLKDLRDKGYVQATSAGRESYYELREPLMRLCIDVKKQRGQPVGLLVDFLRIWYTREELEEHLGGLNAVTNVDREYLSAAVLLSSQDIEDPRMEACMGDWSDCLDQGDAPGALDVATDMVAVEKSAFSWCVHSSTLHLLGRDEEALASVYKALEIAPDDQTALDMRKALLRPLWMGDGGGKGIPGEIERTLLDRGSMFAKALVRLWIGHISDAIETLSAAIREWQQKGMPSYRSRYIAGIFLDFLARQDLPQAERTERLIELVKACPREDTLFVSVSSLAALGTILRDPSVSHERRWSWVNAWKDVASQNEGMLHLPDLMDVMLRFKESGDAKVLLDLPKEVRGILLICLGIKDGDEDHFGAAPGA